jgi:hypothetical protein
VRTDFIENRASIGFITPDLSLSNHVIVNLHFRSLFLMHQLYGYIRQKSNGVLKIFWDFS